MQKRVYTPMALRYQRTEKGKKNLRFLLYEKDKYSVFMLSQEPEPKKTNKNHLKCTTIKF